MKILLFSGTHSRHVYVHEQILKNFDVCGVVVMEREPTIPGKNIKGSNNKIDDWSLNIQELYKQHFNKRDKIEKQYYQSKNIELLA